MPTPGAVMPYNPYQRRVGASGGGLPSTGARATSTLNGQPVYGGGTGTGSASSQASALRAPTVTPVNPMQKESYKAAKGYTDSLMSGTNEMVNREISRSRDDISRGMRAEGEAATGRGVGAGYFRNRALESGARNIGSLQGKLADVSLGRMAEGIGLQTGAAGAAATNQTNLSLGTQQNELGQQRLDLDEAEFQNRVEQQPYERLMDMYRTMGGFEVGGVSSAGMGFL